MVLAEVAVVSNLEAIVLASLENDQLVVDIAGNARCQAIEHSAIVDFSFLAFSVAVEEVVVLAGIAHQFSVDVHVTVAVANFSRHTETIDQEEVGVTGEAGCTGNGHGAVFVGIGDGDAVPGVSHDEALLAVVAFQSFVSH